jgi:hypothetical protein
LKRNGNFQPFPYRHGDERREMKEDEITGYDGYGAVLAFLKGAFADGPVSVAELEVMARAAILLGERQSITNAKAFKRAKRELGIRSVRDGFGAAGEWFWAWPQHPTFLDVPQFAGRLSTKAGKPEDVSRLEPQPQRRCIGVPCEWIHGVANLDRHRAPPHVPVQRWQLLIGDCEQFLELWGATAADMGWSAEALFGCAIAQPLAHLQVAGLLWALRGEKLIRLYPHSASIEISDGSHRIFNRRAIYGTQIALPWRLQ